MSPDTSCSFGIHADSISVDLYPLYPATDNFVADTRHNVDGNKWIQLVSGNNATCVPV